MARSATRAKKKDGIWELIKTVFWALVIAMAFKSILFQPFSIPSGSMKPTLLVGDYLFVTKFSYGYSRYSFPFAPDLFSGRILGSEPERGDVIVFKHPQQDACSQGVIDGTFGFIKVLLGLQGAVSSDCVDYVKRLVGVPGDTVQVRGGVLYLNGAAVDMERIEDFVEPAISLGNPPRRPDCVNAPVGPGGPCAKEQWVETLPNGVMHSVLNIRGRIGDESSRQRTADNTPEFTVPEGHYFFMGDNRDNSVDSRFGSVGLVPYENLIGRADIIVFSSDGAFWQLWNWRFSRMFKLIG